VSHLSHTHLPTEEHPGAHLGQRAESGVHGHHGGTGWHAAAMVTLHCLTGCLIGEWIGLALGVALSLRVGVTVVLATALAYASGFGLTMWPLLRSGVGFWPALSTVFIGEAVSIGVMEVVMNAIDYLTGGMGVKSLFAPRYWEALAVASIAGFLAAWPVNYWLLSRNVKKCH
jgi:Domain of unknown function (DUF4396)